MVVSGTGMTETESLNQVIRDELQDNTHCPSPYHQKKERVLPRDEEAF